MQKKPDDGNFIRVGVVGKMVGAGGHIRDFKMLAGDLSFVAREFVGREDGFCEVEARPCPPYAQVLVGATHAGGKVLEVTDRVADESFFVPACQDPDKGLVGHGPWDVLIR